MADDKNKYDSIDFCLDTLFNFIYGKQRDNICYSLKHINKDSITLNDIKKPKTSKTLKAHEIVHCSNNKCIIFSRKRACLKDKLKIHK